MAKDVEVNHDDIIKLRRGTATKNNEYWSKDEKEELVRMHGEGYGISEMAVHFGRSEGAIVNQLNAKNLMGSSTHCRRAKTPKCRCPKCAFYDECKDRRSEQD